MGLFQDGTPGHSCVICEHWGGPIADGTHALCVRDKDRPYVQARRATGCVYWVKAIGLDDEAPARVRRWDD